MAKGDIGKYKEQLLTRIIENTDLVKALIISDENFLEITPSNEQNQILNNSVNLLYSQIFPYQKSAKTFTKDVGYITSAFVNFRKSGNEYKNGQIYFYILVPEIWVRTSYGNRYDFIIDEIESMFLDKSGIGKFNFISRGDIIDGSFIGGHICYEIVDFR